MHDEGEQMFRRILYTTAVALLCSVPVFLVVVMASDEFLGELPCLSIVPQHRMLGTIYSISAFIAIGIGFFFALGKLPSWMDEIARMRTLRFPSLAFTPKSILSTSLLVFTLWIPVLVILFPCATTASDTINQLYQFFSDSPTYYSATGETIDAEFIDHHPWFDTMMFGGFVWMGRMLGSDALGMFAYGVFQTALTAAALSAAVCYLDKLGIPLLFRQLCLLFVIVFPAFPFSADTMQKDSLFSAFFVIYSIFFFETCRTDGRALQSRRFAIGMAFMVLLCILTKKLGIYIVGISACFLVARLKGVRLTALLTMAIPIAACTLAIPAALFPALHIAPGGSQELFGFMYQQSITVLKEDPESVTEDSLASIDSVIDVDLAMQHYNPAKTDGVKKYQRPSITDKQRARYLVTWLEQGLEHPLLYAKSLARCSAPLLVPSASINLMTDISQSGIAFFSKKADKVGTEFHLYAENPEGLQALVEKIDSFYESTVAAFPIASLFCTTGFYSSWLVLFSLTIALYFRRKNGVLALAPIIVSSFLLIVSPTAFARYALNLVYISILVFGWAIHCSRGSSPKDNSIAGIPR